MGNRAIIAFQDDGEITPFAVYLHWNGGPESIYSFLDVLNERMGGRGADISYAAARFVEIVGRYFGGRLSLGLIGFDDDARGKIQRRATNMRDLSYGDNGLYVIGRADGKLTIVAHCVERRYSLHWLSEDELQSEESDARNHVYFQDHYFADGYKFSRVTMVESVDARAHYGMCKKPKNKYAEPYGYTDAFDAKVRAKSKKRSGCPIKQK